MIPLGINKPNSKTIRNPSANLWSSAWDARAMVPGPTGACVSGRPALLGAGSARESPGPAHSRRHFSALRSPLRAPEPSRRPPSFSAPCPGPAACCTLHRPARSAALGLGPGRGRCRHPLEPGCSRGSCFFLSPLKGWPEKGRGFCKVCWGCTRAPEERPLLRRTD